MTRSIVPTIAAALVALAAACTVPDATFAPSVDSGIDAAADHHLELDPADVTIGEGETRSFTLRAVPPPEQAVEVELMSGAGVLGLPGRTVTLTAGQATVMFDVTALEDPDAQDGHTTLTANLLGYDSGSSSVTVDDDEELTIEVTPSDELTIRENSSGQLDVVLGAQPIDDVIVTVGTTDMSVARVSDGSLTFTADNWMMPQTVDVIGVRDQDVVNEDIAVTFDSPPLPARSVTVHVTDIDRQNILAQESSIDVHEGQPGGTLLHVYLAQQPAADIVVDVQPQDQHIRVSETSLTFRPGDFGTPQTIIVTADGDDNVAGFASSIRFDAAVIEDPLSVAVDVIDDDHQQIVVAAPSPFQVTEEQDATFTARLRFRPAGDTVLAVTSLDAAIASAMPGAITFTDSGLTAWDRPQPITVRGLPDDDVLPAAARIKLEVANVPTVQVDAAIVDDDRVELALASVPLTIGEGMQGAFTVALTHKPPAAFQLLVTSGDSAITTPAQPLSFDLQNWSTPHPVMLDAPADADLISEQVVITLASPGNVPQQTVTIGVVDTTQQGIVTSPSMVTVVEGGASTSVGVSLSNPPLGPITLTVSSSSTQVSATAADLNFDPGNWNTPKPVVISAQGDVDVVGGNAIVTLRGPNLSDKLISVTTTDLDHVDLRTSVPAVSTTEGMMTGFTVSLTHQPTAPVDVTVATDDAGAATVMPASFTIQPANWNQPVTVNVRGEQDDDLASETTPLHVRSNGLATVDVTATVTDDDHQAIVLTNAPAALIEGGAGATFTVQLAYRPAVDVVVNLGSSDNSVLQLNQSSFTFNSGTWNAPKSVTVNAPIDVDLVDSTGTITVSTPNGAPNNAPARMFDIAIDDQDVLAIVSSDNNVAVTEHAAGKVIQVKLNKQPTGNVRITATPSSGLAGVSPGFRDYTVANWSMNQDFTITAPDDTDTVGGNAVVTLATSPMVTQPVAVNVAVTDPDQQQVQITAANPFVVSETGSRSFNVHLRYNPVNNLVVTLGYDAAVVGLSAGNLTFNATNWQTGVDVTVTPLHDVDMTDSTTMITATAGALSASLTASIDDADVQTIVVGAANVNVVEGNMATFTVKLDRRPAANTLVTVTSANGNKVSVSGNLTFMPAMYNVNQTVTVTGVADADVADELIAVTLTNPDAPNPATVQVAVDDQTVITDVGWSTYFGTASSWSAGTAAAFPITIAQAGKLDAFGLITGAAGSEAKMALYANAGGVPGALVASIDNPVSLGAGTVLLDVADIPVAAGSYWIAVRVNPSASIGSTAAMTGTRCTKSMPTFTNAWPATWGTTSCGTAGLLNVFARTYRP